jgi:hypothetical protein
MLLLATTTDKLQIITSSTSALDVHASYVDASNTTLVPSGGGKQNTAIASAATTDVLAVPGASTVRNLKAMTVRNKGSASNDVTVQFNQNGTLFEIYKVTLLPGFTLQYFEDAGWIMSTAPNFFRIMRVGTAYVNATTGFTDITGLQAAVKSGLNYEFDAMLIHANDASTTGSRFGINGPSLTNVLVSTIDTVTTSTTASAHSSGTAAAVDTAATAQSTGSTNNRLAVIAGSFTAGADGTFSMRGASEIGIAAGLTVRVGSHCKIWTATG